MGLPTHRTESVRARLARQWSKAHKNWTGGYPTKTEVEALAQDDDSYLVGGNAQHSDLAVNGTVDRAIDAAVNDRAARNGGDTRGA